MVVICNKIDSCKRNHECAHSSPHIKDEGTEWEESTCDHSFCAGVSNVVCVAV